MSKNVFGIYRGTAVNTADPSAGGRVQVVVAGIGSSALGWALPCFSPGNLTLPNVGDNVWVMFEGGDTDYPVWIGKFP